MNVIRMLAAITLSPVLVVLSPILNEERQPDFARITLVRFVVKSRVLEGAAKRSDEDAVLQELSEQATRQAERVLLRKRIAGSVERVRTQQEAAGKVTVIGTVQVPVALPPRIIGFAAARKRGTFATGKVTILDVSGKVLAEQKVEVPWRDGWWIVGGRARRNARLDDVPPDMARKAADRPLQRLARTLKEKRRDEFRREHL